MLLATVNVSRIAALIRHAPDIARPIMTTFLNDSTRALVSSSGKVPGLVQVMPPHSEKVGGIKAKKQGEAKVMADIWKVYAPPGKIYQLIKATAPLAAKGFWGHIQKKQWKQAEDIMNRTLGKKFTSFDDGAAHMARRSRQGRVNNKTPTVFVQNGTLVRRYIKRRQKNVGLLAAVVPAAYNGRYGPLRGIPAWIARHSASWASGFMRERKSTNGLEITITINAAALNKDLQRRFTYVVNYRLGAMKRQLPYIATAIENKLAQQLHAA